MPVDTFFDTDPVIAISLSAPLIKSGRPFCPVIVLVSGQWSSLLLIKSTPEVNHRINWIGTLWGFRLKMIFQKALFGYSYPFVFRADMRCDLVLLASDALGSS